MKGTVVGVEWCKEEYKITPPVSDNSKDKKEEEGTGICSEPRPSRNLRVASLSETISMASIHRQEDEGFKFNPSIELLWVWSIYIDLSLIILLSI